MTLCSLLLASCYGHKARRTGHADAPPPRLAEVETANLRAVPGYTGDRLGAEITDISNLPGEDTQAIGISIPIESGRVDRIEVVSPEGEPIQQQREADILQQGDGNNVGIRLFLPKRSNWEFRLRLIDVPDDQ
ncbi:MAG: hypothetical protein OEO19_15120 [Gammaproteobacteria bacterium]|nr:hypothetical protein [Gammaproteobacteria bacterium]